MAPARANVADHRRRHAGRRARARRRRARRPVRGRRLRAARRGRRREGRDHRRDRRRRGDRRVRSAGGSSSATSACTGYVAPLASARRWGCARRTTGCCCSAMTLVIWAIEAGVWMSVGAAVGFGMDPIEGLYLVALASVFSMIPSGPGLRGHAGRGRRDRDQGARRNGRDRRCVSADVALRHRGADNAGGIHPAGRPLRRAFTSAREAESPLTAAAATATAPAASGRVRALVRRAGRRASSRVWGVLVAVALILRLIGLGDRPFHHDESQDAYFSYIFRQTRRLPVQPAAARAAALLPDGGDVRAVRRQRTSPRGSPRR